MKNPVINLPVVGVGEGTVVDRGGVTCSVVDATEIENIYNFSIHLEEFS